MAGEDDDKTPKSDGEPQRGRARRTRTPVTIDLKAEPAPPEPAVPEKAAEEKKPAPSEPASAEPAKAEAAKAAAPAAKSEPVAAKPETPKPEPAKPASAAAEPAKPAAPPPPQPPRSDPPRGNRPPGAAAIGSDDSWIRPALAGVAGGIAAFLLLLVLQGIGLLPAPGRGAATAASDAAKAATQAVAGLERRMSAVEMMTQDLPAKGTLETFDGRIAALEKAQASLASKETLDALKLRVAGFGAWRDVMFRGVEGNLGNTLADIKKAQAALATGESVDALKLRVDGLGSKMDALLGGDLAELKDRVAKLEIGGGAGSGGTVDESAVTALSGRIDAVQASLKALDGRLASLESQAGQGDGAAAAAAKAIAAMTLRRAASGDGPFVTDLNLAASLGLAADDVAALRPLAEKGAPTPATLAAQFPAVGEAIIAATGAPAPDAGFFERLMAAIGGLVTVRPAGPMTGDDPLAIVSRMRAAVDAGKLDVALKERAALAETGKAVSAEWAAAAEDRVQIDALVEKIAGSVTGTPPA